jgi:cysteine synthase
MEDKFKNMNIFLGPEGHKHYTDPRQHAPTSLVELPSSFILANFPLLSQEDRVRVAIKRMNENPFNTTKTSPVYYWYERLEAEGKINDETIATVGTSGGLGIPFIAIGRLFGIKHFKLFVPKDANSSKVWIIDRVGGEALELKRTPEVLTENAAALARALIGEPHHEVFDQYDDEINSEAHKAVTITQIWEQTALAGVELSGIAFGSGTFGSVNAGRELLDEKGSNALAIAIICEEKNPLPGMRAESRLSREQVPLAHKHSSIIRWKIPRYPAYSMTIKLLGIGQSVGLTTGGGVFGTLNWLEGVRHYNSELWEELKNNVGDRFFVVTNADILELYLHQIAPILDADDMDVMKLDHRT